MTLDEWCDTYGCCFRLKEGKTLKDLEDYGFEPEYDSRTGELISETIFLRYTPYKCNYEVEEAVLCMTAEDIEVSDDYENCTNYNPMRKKIMNFFNLKKQDEYYRYLRCLNCDAPAINIDFKRFETTQMSLILTLIEDGIIERDYWNNKGTNFGRKTERGKNE